ncbi:MAG: hypothetical protein ACREPY_18310 [Rhodanobacteraceae bacterium]
MLRQNQSIGGEKPELDAAAAAMDALERKRKVAARRTAWILGVIAAAFFIAALVHGHYAYISHWPS